jgi:hypothetical protein
VGGTFIPANLFVLWGYVVKKLTTKNTKNPRKKTINLISFFVPFGLSFVDFVVKKKPSTNYANIPNISRAGSHAGVACPDVIANER